MNRVFIKTYGCQMNERDSEAVAAMLRDRGYSIVDTEANADVVLLNTCSVRDQAEQKAIGKAGHVLKAKRRNPSFVLGIMGCMAQNRGQALLDSLPDLDLIIGTQKFHKIPDHLDNLLASFKAQGPRPSTLVDTEEEADSQNTIKDHLAPHKKATAFVSIMQGCNMNCSYCIVPTTRGTERSRSIESIVEEIKLLAEKGVKEITLLGQIVTSYGRGTIPFKDRKSPFVQLLEAINSLEGIKRIRFTSPHPLGFKADLIEAFSYLPKLCPYVHLPLQSGSNRMLKAMNRPYFIERYQEIIDGLRAVNSDMYLSTDIIVGFPGETDADFEETRLVFESINFDMAYIFKFSPRQGTIAADLEDDISQAVKEERNQVLLEILKSSSLKRNQSLLGTIQEVLVEEPAKKGENIYWGRTPGNRKVFFPARERLIGELVQIKIEEASMSSLKGSLILPTVMD
jgi:tRNA-2-methylthio-N6-dimethylallyladenosine synthase